MDATSSESEQLRKSLGKELRNLRIKKGMSGQRLGQLAAMSQSKLSKIELGKLRVSRTDVDNLLKALRCESVEIVEILNQLEVLEQNPVEEDLQIQAMRDELLATEFRSNASLAIPGLLQTPSYARHIFTNEWRYGPISLDEVNRRIVRRCQRQALLADVNRHFRFAIAKHLLEQLQQLGNVGVGQLERLSYLALEPNIEIAIVDATAMSNARIRTDMVHANILDDRVAYLELIGSYPRRDHPQEVKILIDSFEETWKQADHNAKSAILKHLNTLA